MCVPWGLTRMAIWNLVSIGKHLFPAHIYSISVTLGKSFNLCEYASSYINVMYLKELLESNALP